MQTFLPYPDFARTATTLDPRRLGKQRVETIQVLRGLTRPGYGWRNHPAVKMWAGYEEALVRYGLDICAVWRAGGRADTCAATLVTDLAAGCGPSLVREQAELAAVGELPPWLGRDDLHLSHRSSLLRKDPDFYRPLFGDIADDLEYVWPPSDRAPSCSAVLGRNASAPSGDDKGLSRG
ncbi:MSMEG_6728 family protein [Plantactinospora sp. GCM10030261]|uniref:MSMEG_6728 family protein n=1 Tax=Plantactinospora sp. GCM10030261 TaxID=3273420 RepID=UPI003612EE4D